MASISYSICIWCFLQNFLEYFISLSYFEVDSNTIIHTFHHFIFSIAFLFIWELFSFILPPFLWKNIHWLFIIVLIRHQYSLFLFSCFLLKLRNSLAWDCLGLIIFLLVYLVILILMDFFLRFSSIILFSIIMVVFFI